MSIIPKLKNTKHDLEEHFEERLTVSSCVITQKPGDKYVNIERKSAEYKIKGNEPLVASEQAIQGKVHKSNLTKYFSDANHMFPSYFSSS